MQLASKPKDETVKVENGTSNRGAVLLAELKALVDSLPHHQRGNVIKMLEITFRELNADCQGRHSIGVQPEARTAIDSPSRKTSAGPDSRHEFKTKIENRRKE